MRQNTLYPIAPALLLALLGACATSSSPKGPALAPVVENVPPADQALDDEADDDPAGAEAEAPAVVRGPPLPAAWYERRGQEIEAGLRRLQPVLQSCTATLSSRPAGELLVYLQVSRGGRVTLVRLEENSVARKSASFETCVKGTLSRLHVTADPGGELVGVRKRYVFGARP